MNSRSVTAMILAYLVPGAGHAYLGQRARGAVFFAILCVMFSVGILIDGRVYSFVPGQLLTNLATLGSMGSGLLYFAGHRLSSGGDVYSITFEHGTAFTLTAGLMNLLLVLDCWDIAQGRKE